ncbi:uncharacterized protein C10orf143-like isoform X2 [Heptranchias perlo]|uniref:uncharacterized protein C10orf143-like isoform X2 n=1 Tax=Heptranchias perlo TaxID=212740 RepID=UPI00355A7556
MSVSMDYLVTVQKRRINEELGCWGRVGKPDNKRICQGLDGSFPVENDVPYTQLNWSSIDHWNLQKHFQPEGLMSKTVTLPNVDKLAFVMQQNHVQASISKPCPRCLAGESGHINHIMAG